MSHSLDSILENCAEQYNEALASKIKTIRTIFFHGSYNPYRLNPVFEFNPADDSQDSRLLCTKYRGIYGWINLETLYRDGIDVRLMEKSNIHFCDRTGQSYSTFLSNRYSHGYRVWIYLDDFPEALGDAHQLWESRLHAIKKERMFESLKGRDSLEDFNPQDLSITYRGQVKL